MALDPVNLPGLEDDRGVHFAMRNGSRSVRVLVTREALQGEGKPLTAGEYIARFKTFRDVYEAIAKEKFDESQRQPSMKIELADFAQYLSGRQR
jgi:hypothetical protein